MAAQFFKSDSASANEPPEPEHESLVTLLSPIEHVQEVCTIVCIDIGGNLGIAEESQYRIQVRYCTTRPRRKEFAHALPPSIYITSSAVGLAKRLCLSTSVCAPDNSSIDGCVF